jgi:hypothetical protein
VCSKLCPRFLNVRILLVEEARYSHGRFCFRGSAGGFGFGGFAVQGGEEFLGGRRCGHCALENDVLGTQALVVQLLVGVLVGPEGRALERDSSKKSSGTRITENLRTQSDALISGFGFWRTGIRAVRLSGQPLPTTHAMRFSAYFVGRMNSVGSSQMQPRLREMSGKRFIRHVDSSRVRRHLCLTGVEYERAMPGRAVERRSPARPLEISFNQACAGAPNFTKMRAKAPQARPSAKGEFQ